MTVLAKNLSVAEVRRQLRLMRSDHRDDWVTHETNFWSDLAPFTFSTKSSWVKSAHGKPNFIIIFQKNSQDRKTLISKSMSVGLHKGTAWGQIPERVLTQQILKSLRCTPHVTTAAPSQFRSANPAFDWLKWSVVKGIHHCLNLIFLNT